MENNLNEDNEDKKKEIAHSLKSIFSAITNAIDEEAITKGADYLKLVREENKHLDMSRIEHMNIVMSLEFQSLIRQFIQEELHKKGYLNNQIEELMFFYLHGDFVEHQLDRFIETHEGFGCSADKTRFFLESYVQFVLNGKVPTLDHTKYWCPNYGTIQEWFDFMHSMRDLYYGKPQKYIEALASLLKYYQSTTKES